MTTLMQIRDSKSDQSLPVWWLCMKAVREGALSLLKCNNWLEQAELWTKCLLPGGLILCNTKKSTYVSKRKRSVINSHLLLSTLNGMKFISEALTLTVAHEFKGYVLLVPCGWTGHITLWTEIWKNTKYWAKANKNKSAFRCTVLKAWNAIH